MNDKEFKISIEDALKEAYHEGYNAAAKNVCDAIAVSVNRLQDLLIKPLNKDKKKNSNG